MRTYLYILLLSVCTPGLFAQTYRPRMTTAIDMGVHSDFFTYSDTKNTSAYTDDYTHRFYDPYTDGYYTEPPARDVFYKLTITGKSMQLKINDYGSSFSNGTRIYILDATGQEIAYGEPYNSSYQTFIYSLQPGTYYIVTEALTYEGSPSDIGSMQTNVEGVARRTGEDFFYPAILGTFSAGFNTSHTINIDDLKYYKCDFKNGSELDAESDRRDLVHQFTITKPMDISLDNTGSARIESMQTLYLHILSASMDTIAEVSIQNKNLSTQKINYELPPGTYYVFSKFSMEQYSDAKYVLNVTGKEQLVGSSLSNPVNIGSKSANFTYSHTQNTSLFSKSRVDTKSGNEAFYKFTLTVPMEITVDNCGSGVTDTYLQVLSADQHQLYANDAYTGTGACANTQNAYLKVPALLPGTYYIVSDGEQNGNITTTLKGTTIGPVGDKLSTAIDAGTHEVGFIFTDTKNTASAFTNQFTGKSTNDVFYKFKLTNPMDITVSHCGSAVTDTYMSLLNESGTMIYSNDNYSGEGKCSNTGNALIKVTQLPAGTYYVVSEGNTQNGSITTSIEARSAFGNINTSRGQPHIISVTPTVETDKLENLTADKMQRNIQYFDSFGNPSVNVQLDFSPLGGDLVTLQENDGFSRKSNSWLPVAINTSGGLYPAPQLIKTKAKATTLYGSDQRPYSQTVYDDSPLDLVVEQYGPGNDWYTNSRSVKTDRMANFGSSGVLACAQYVLNGTSAVPTFKKNGFYADYELYVTRTTDEDNNISYEFKDKAGRMVLSRKISGSVPYDTYYIYDNYGNLSFVLPPLAADALTATNTTWKESTAAVENYAYIYHYDTYNRCIWKKLPGCEAVYYVYDKADRLIYTQDGEQRAKTTPEWTFTIPDAFGRTALTGKCTNNLAYQANPLANVLVKASYAGGTNAMKGYTVSGVTLAGPQLLTVNYYDGYTFVNTNGIAGDAEVDIVLHAYEDAYVAATASITLQNGFHVPVGSNFRAVITGASAGDTSGTNFGIPSQNVKGLLTGTLTAQLNANGTIGSTYLYSVLYYDNRGRLIQTNSNNHLPGGTEKEYTAYNFAGQPVKRKHVHAATGRNTQTEVVTYTYDQTGRSLKTTHQLTDGTTVKPQVTLAANSYDDLGRLQTLAKNSQAKLTTNYAYNIRSWTKSITAPLFNEILYYNESYGGSAKRYNGNISAISWKHTDESFTRGYAFTYDPLSRLTASAYLQDATVNDHYKTSYTYDKQGNMLTQQRYGLINTTTYGLMDNLTMTHSGNQLTKAEDAAGSAGFKNYSNVATEYTYNKNGSMIKDLNKGISLTEYNSLDLPRQLDIKSPGAEARKEYTYSADGRKLKVVQRWNPNYSTTPVMGSAINAGSLTMTRTTDYAGNIIYEDGALKRVL
ncbi:pre-peptidase C-terminal domain-containing protein [bacterium A37T11]|nr:pre-peptidase C-terminal domain-containing protein [bacterium A37T11]